MPDVPVCTCDRDTILDGMARPGCPVHAPARVVSDVPDKTVEVGEDVLEADPFGEAKVADVLSACMDPANFTANPDDQLVTVGQAKAAAMKLGRSPRLMGEYLAREARRVACPPPARD